MIDDVVEIGGVVRRARGRRRKVDGVNVERGMTEVDFCCDRFDDVVVGEEGGDVDWRKFQVVADKESDTTTTAIWPIALMQRIVPE